MLILNIQQGEPIISIVRLGEREEGIVIFNLNVFFLSLIGYLFNSYNKKYIAGGI